MNIILPFLLFLILAIPAHADIIELKDGRTVEGKIIKKTNKYVQIEILSGASIKYPLKSVESIKEMELSVPLVPAASSPFYNAPVIEPKSPINIKLNPMIELDFKSKDEVYEIRKDYVMQYPQLAKKLVKGRYRPLDATFGQIEDKKAWWGILGLSYYGNSGTKSIEGPSEESRFVANPYLLIGLDSGVALSVDDPHLSPIEIYPVPLSLVWDSDCSLAKVKYDVSSLWQKHRQYHDAAVEERGLMLVALNARDFGFNYLYVDYAKSTNVQPVHPTSGAALVLDFIHCGATCGYPGGCNNLSPDQPALKIRVSSLPALAQIKLWKKNPANVDEPPDMLYLLEMI